MSDNAPGFEKYTPTRLDWLTVMLNAQFSYDNARSDRFTLSYLPGEDGKSLSVIVRHLLMQIKSGWMKRLILRRRLF